MEEVDELKAQEKILDILRENQRLAREVRPAPKKVAA